MDKHGILRIFLTTFLLFPAISTCHMTLDYPPPINYRGNPYSTSVDYDYSAPLSPSGSNYPCRGQLKALGTSAAQPVVTWTQGQTVQIKFAGSATHAGGSCQASLSYDKGRTFEVIKSWIGNCVHAAPGGDQTFSLPIPKNAPNGNGIIFAWTWFNNEGNREMYMNCAIINIGSSRRRRHAGPFFSDSEFEYNSTDYAPLEKRALGPTIFLANIGNGCTTPAGKDVVFPQPGSVVEVSPSQANFANPVGNCGPGNGYDGKNGGTGGGGGGTGGGTSGNGLQGGAGTTSDVSKWCAWRAQAGYPCSAASGLPKLQQWGIVFGVLGWMGWIVVI